MLADGSRVGYDFLVVAVGIQLNWEAIDGMRADLVGRHGICSNYLYDGCEITWRTLQDFKGGTALFTNPAATDQVRRRAAEDHVPRGRPLRGGPACGTGRGSSSHRARPGIFSVKEFAKTLDEVIARKGIETMYKHTLMAIRPEQRQAVLQPHRDRRGDRRSTTR